MANEQAVATPSTRKANFTIQGDTFEDLLVNLVKLVPEHEEAGLVDIMQSKQAAIKKVDSKYGNWRYEIEGRDHEMRLQAGIPIGVTVQVIWHKLTDEKGYEVQAERNKASKAASIESLRARLARLEGKK